MAWRRSPPPPAPASASTPAAGGGQTTSDWPALQANYAYLMDYDLIECCRNVVAGELTGYTPPFFIINFFFLLEIVLSLHASRGCCLGLFICIFFSFGCLISFFYKLKKKNVGFYCVAMGFTRYYWVLMGITGFYWVLFGFTGFYGLLLGFIEFYGLLLGSTKICSLLPDVN